MHDLDRIQTEFEDIDQSNPQSLFTGDKGHTVGAEFEFEAEFEYEDEFETEFETEFEDEFEDEFENFDDPSEFDEFEEFDDASSLAEAEEFELAAELLAATTEAELEGAVRKIVRPRPSRPGTTRQRRRAKAGSGAKSGAKRKRRRGFIGKALKGIAKKALPLVAGAVGSLIAPGIGTAAGAALGKGIGKAFNLELESLSPEDAQFEVARGIVRLGAAAAEESDHIETSVDDETAAKVGVIRASAKHAPGVVPRKAIKRVRKAANRLAEGSASSGRWIRRDGQIVLLGL